MLGQRVRDPFIAPSSKPQWGLTLTEPPSFYFYRSTIRSRSDGKKLSIPSTSRTPAARRGATSTNFKKRPLHCNIQMGAIVWRVSWLTTLFITFLVNPLTISSSVPWFSQRITQSYSIYYLYLWFFNQTPGHSHLKLRL